MKLLKGRSKKGKLRVQGIEQRQQEDDYGDNIIVRDIEDAVKISSSSELDEKDQFEIIVIKKDRKGTSEQKSVQLKTRYVGLLSTQFRTKKYDDSSTISSITTEGKRRLRLLQAGIIHVATSTSPVTSWCSSCCNDSATQGNEQTLEMTTSVEKPAPEVTTSVRSTPKSVRKKIYKTHTLADNTLVAQPSYSVNPKMQEHFIASIQQRKEQMARNGKEQQRQEKNDSIFGFFQVLTCGADTTTNNNCRLSDISSGKAAKKSCGGSGAHDTAGSHTAALFDTLSEDEGDIENNQHKKQQEKQKNKNTGRSNSQLAEALRNSGSRLLRRISNAGGSHQAIKTTKRRKIAFKKGESFLRSPSSMFRNKRIKDPLRATNSGTVLDQDISAFASNSSIMNNYSTYVEPVSLIAPPAFPLTRTPEIKL